MLSSIIARKRGINGKDVKTESLEKKKPISNLGMA